MSTVTSVFTVATPVSLYSETLIRLRRAPVSRYDNISHYFLEHLLMSAVTSLITVATSVSLYSKTLIRLTRTPVSLYSNISHYVV